MSKILLINPYSPSYYDLGEHHIPLSMLYLGAYLKKFGHEVVFVDFNCFQVNCIIRREKFLLDDHYREKLAPVLSSFKPDVVGATIHFSGRFRPTIEICQRIKATHPDLPIVIGGLHPTLHPQNILKEYKIFDFILQGESEDTLLQLVESLAKKDSAYATIDGIGFRKDDGEVVVRPKASFIEKVDDLPFPDYGLVNVKDYYFDTTKWYNPKQLPINLSMFLISGRSCPRKCTFCCMWKAHGPSARLRSAKNVVDEIEHLYYKYDQRYFSFVDDNFTINKQRTIDICGEIIRRGLDIQFDTPNGVELMSLNEEVIDSLVKTGLIRTNLPVESGSPMMRKSMRKALPQEKIYEVFNIVKKYPRLRYNAFFIIGFPNETKETLEETYQLIKELELKQAIISFATPFAGTTLFEECVKNNLINPKDIHNQENFYFGNKDPFIKPYNLEKQDLVDFRQKIYSELNMSNYLVKQVA